MNTINNRTKLIIKRDEYFNELLEILYNLEDIDGYNHKSVNTKLINALREFIKEEER